MDQAAVTTITSAVDYATIVTGIGTVAAAGVGLILAYKGAQMLLRSIRGL